MNIRFRFQAPATIRLALCCITAGLCMSCTASAQEYTLRDLVEQYDAMIVARIDSKQPMEISVKTTQYDGRVFTSTTIFTKYRITPIKYIGPRRFREMNEFVLPGGRIGRRERISTHTPSLEVGWEILVAIEYDELNDYYILGGGSTRWASRSRIYFERDTRQEGIHSV